MENRNQITVKDYIHRTNKALKYIDKNLDTELSLETVSREAGYSPYHFHRIFKAVTNEPLNAYITRRRVEKAAAILIREKEITITELSLKHGFTSNSSFTRAFKKFYGISPKEFRKNSPSRYSKISKVKSKNGQETVAFEQYICNIENHKKWISMNAKIEVKELPELHLAYISHIGIDNIDATFDRLMKWSRPKGLLDVPDLKMVTIYHDSLKITSPEKVRVSACIHLKAPIDTDGEVGFKTIEAGKYVVGHVEVAPNEFEQAWTGLFVWLNENGYKVAKKDCFGIFYNDFRQHPEYKSTADLCIPIE